MPKTPVTSTRVQRFESSGVVRTDDLVAVEEPLQLVLEHGPGHARTETPLAVTMRTPGHDLDLALGFLHGEGVIDRLTDVIDVRHCPTAETPHNLVRVVLRPERSVPTAMLERSLLVSSSCGVCGERTIAALTKSGCRSLSTAGPPLDAAVIHRAVSTLEASQTCFRNTGGTHGAALFDRSGTPICVREDVGRHNALDKLVGAQLREPGALAALAVISSRASFELVQKCVRARVPVLVAVGAPSSLAIETAQRFELSLLAFARDERFNVYSASRRIFASRKAPVRVLEAGGPQ